VLTVFSLLISTSNDSVIQKVQATNVIEANNTAASSSMINDIVTKIVKVNDIEVKVNYYSLSQVFQ